ncbi:unnamed protein product [Enterobius vermicularis]|uniref:EF-hand domain-containing protein n=1 Tax=Enterobius vermicularis TaxID=51028 RepID=A0A0N4VC15_ENTVE|nr:unnamed protein product [Enterobius vermicularis]
MHETVFEKVLTLAIYEMLGPEAKKATDVAPKEKAKTIFAKIDVNGDKQITQKEFVDGCLADKELFHILTNEGDR